MFEPLTILFAVLWVLTAVVALWQWYMKKAVARHVNRRLVAYEGKLRNLGHEPDRVYHDFENMLEESIDDRQAEEFNTEEKDG
jgi:hypothetical protein